MSKPEPGAFVVSEELEGQLGSIHGGWELLDALATARRDADEQRQRADVLANQLRALLKAEDAVNAAQLSLTEATALANLQSASHWMAEAERAQQRADELATALEGLRDRWSGCWCATDERHDKECLAAQAALAVALPEGKP